LAKPGQGQGNQPGRPPVLPAREAQMKQIPISSYRGRWYKFGCLGDTHLCSKYERLDVLNAAYKVFRKEGVKAVFHGGDVLDGERVYRGQEYELHTIGATSQVKYVVDKYPHFRGITTYFCTGNHDLSHWKRSQVDVGRMITERRSDMMYLGQEEADVMIGGVRIRLSHPGKGAAYSLSYHPQKYIEALSGGQKPNILLIAHYHKAELLPCYRNVFALQCGTLQSQTPFMRRNNLAAHVGFWIVEFCVDKDGSLMRFKAEFFAYYEQREVQEIPENRFLSKVMGGSK